MIDYEALTERAFEREPQNIQELEGFGMGVYSMTKALREFLQDKIVLAREEVREAKQDFERNRGKRDHSLPCLFTYEERCQVRLKALGLCRLCKKLTEFAEGEEDE